MNYPDVIRFLYDSLPMYQRAGRSAIKYDLSNIRSLCEHLQNPQDQYETIHVGGTNGKGSSSHMLASVLQESGKKTGLYTSPHLKDFTERIKINGNEIPKEKVVQFVESNLPFIKSLQPSFFEITVAMAFWYFALEEVDIAVIEVGLGGRLDSTNIINPEICLITNISLDHTQMLGTTIQEIAFEKAGIIKPKTPVVIGESSPDSAFVFKTVALEKEAIIVFADQVYKVDGAGKVYKNGELVADIDITGWPDYQLKNIPGVITVLDQLAEKGHDFDLRLIQKGIQNFQGNTQLKGRWQVISNSPLTICDTGHNEGGIKAIVEEITKLRYDNLYIVWGMVIDKSVNDLLRLLPANAYYYFCRPDIPRGMQAEHIHAVARNMGLKGEVVVDVNDALEAARKAAKRNDMIFIGGSTFVVAELNDL